jgi:chromosome segregation ATPase
LKDEKEKIISEKSQMISDLETKLLEVTINKSECEDIQRLRDENETLIAEREEHLVAIEDMKVRLTEFQSWTETAQLRINDLEAEKESIEKELQGIKSGEASDNGQDYVLREDLVVPSDSVDVDKMVESSYDLPSVSNMYDEEINQKNDGSIASPQILADEEESLKKRLKDKVFTLEAELSQLRISIEEKDTRIQILSKDMESSQSTENDGLHTEIASLRVSICDLEYKNQELSKENESLQKSCSDLRTQIHDVENMLAKKETEISDFMGKVEEAKVTASVLRNEYENAQKHTNDIIKDLESENAKLHSTIQNQEHETEAAISEWDLRCQDLEGEIEKLRSESNAQQDALAAISQWESRCSELEEEIKRLVSEQDLIGREELEHEIEELKSTIAFLQDEANNAISQWEERSTEMEEEIQRLMSECSEMETLRQQLTTNDILIKELMANVDVERENLVIVQKEKEDAETIYRSHIEELEGAITSHEQENLFLQSQLDEREDLVERTNQQVLALSKELDEIRTQSETVVMEWQGKMNRNPFFVSHYDEFLMFMKSNRK